MKILVTGHKGFIGNHLYNRLVKDGHNVEGLDLKESFDINICNFKEKYDIIYHLAAKASIPNSFKEPIESHKNNVLSLIKILEYAKKVKAKVVFSSSAAVYTKDSPYAIQKLCCEEYLKFYWQLGVKSVALRYFNVYGEGQERANDGKPMLALADFLNEYKHGRSIKYNGTGEHRRDFVYVGDVVEANVKAGYWLNNASEFENIDIGSGVNYSIKELLDTISITHPRIKMPERQEVFSNLADIRKAEELLNWSPTTDVKDWIKTQINA